MGVVQEEGSLSGGLSLVRQVTWRDRWALPSPPYTSPTPPLPALHPAPDPHPHLRFLWKSPWQRTLALGLRFSELQESGWVVPWQRLRLRNGRRPVDAGRFSRPSRGLLSNSNSIPGDLSAAHTHPKAGHLFSTASWL